MCIYFEGCRLKVFYEEVFILKKIFSNYPDVVSLPDLMKMLNIGRNTAYSLLQNGELKSIKVGKQYRIPKQFIIEYLKCC